MHALSFCWKLIKVLVVLSIIGATIFWLYEAIHCLSVGTKAARENSVGYFAAFLVGLMCLFGFLDASDPDNQRGLF